MCIIFILVILLFNLVVSTTCIYNIRNIICYGSSTEPAIECKAKFTKT